MKVDKNKKYYKVVDEKGHYGVKYRLGLNIDPLPFNDDKDDECVKSEIHFSDLDNIFSYFHCGDYVAEVSIPADAKVCCNNSWDKARADKIIINKIMSKEEFISWLIDSEQFNWEEYSWAIAMFCVDRLDPERFNWEEHSWVVAMFCPDKLDTERFNWKEYSWVVAEYCPCKIDPEKYDWQAWSHYVAKHCPDKLVPEKFNWKQDSWAVVEYCQEKMKLRPNDK